jgi:phosphatidylserine decarboxylase
MRIRQEVLPFIGITAVVSLCAGFVLSTLLLGALLFLIGTVCLLHFFRDPERTPPPDSAAILAGADGRVMSITRLVERLHLQTECVRISIFLSLFDVHVNRAPMAGRSMFLGYFPGRMFFAFQEKSSELNQHNKILIEGPRTRCLVTQIAGPVARRVVYWLSHEMPTPVEAGDRIGMMKFGSRLDIYLPAADVDVLAQPGDRVRAGETVIARTKPVGTDERKMNLKDSEAGMNWVKRKIES